jgi:hypothetical protein
VRFLFTNSLPWCIIRKAATEVLNFPERLDTDDFFRNFLCIIAEIAQLDDLLFAGVKFLKNFPSLDIKCPMAGDILCACPNFNTIQRRCYEVRAREYSSKFPFESILNSITRKELSRWYSK